MGLFDFFADKKELCKTDACINVAMDFIKIIHSYKSFDCPMFEVSFGDTSIGFYFFDSNNTTPCIFKDMVYRKQVEEEFANQRIGEAIHADELPKGTTIEIHFDKESNTYDYYVLRYNIITEHKKCGTIYREYVKNICKELKLCFEEKGNSLSFKLK